MVKSLSAILNRFGFLCFVLTIARQPAKDYSDLEFFVELLIICAIVTTLKRLEKDDDVG